MDKCNYCGSDKHRVDDCDELKEAKRKEDYEGLPEQEYINREKNKSFKVGYNKAEAEIKRLKAVIGDVTEICNEVWICQEFKYVKDEYKFNIEKRNDKLKRIKEAVSKLREGR